ncbi:MAG: TetR/AcrR family transcriptional regulator C-terminal domain-containing protein [Myxococcota bacterium]|jgi:AcrR family transcriptional regulator|nr:TetR/AcrR family transcriptional regulator C-terminal domain-containing protein [Myxococcota bacterium]
MAKRKSLKREKRLPLDRERVLRAAITLADKEGIGALSMRKLGQMLGVEAMSLYNHVANKDEVLEGIADIIVGDIGPIEGESSWQDSMRSRAAAMRRVFADHPWALGLLESRRTLGPAALHYCDSVLGVLRRAGFSPLMAMRAFSLLDSYSYGYCIQEKSLPSSSAQEAAEATEQLMQQLPDGEYPNLVEIATTFLQSGFDFTKEFEFGLELLLKALEAFCVKEEVAEPAAGLTPIGRGFPRS